MWFIQPYTSRDKVTHVNTFIWYDINMHMYMERGSTNSYYNIALAGVCRATTCGCKACTACTSKRFSHDYLSMYRFCIKDLGCTIIYM